MDYKDIKFEHQFHSEKYIKFRQKLFYFLMATPLLFVISFALLMPSAIDQDAKVKAALMVLLLLMLAAMITLIASYAAVIPVNEHKDADSDLGWEWLEARYCNDLLDLCQKDSDLNDYRLRVIAEGRRFTWAEYVAMKKWPEQKRRIQANLLEKRNHEAQCKTLYES